MQYVTVCVCAVFYVCQCLSHAQRIKEGWNAFVCDSQGRSKVHLWQSTLSLASVHRCASDARMIHDETKGDSSISSFHNVLPCLNALGQESPCSSWFQLAKILSAALDRSRRQEWDRLTCTYQILPVQKNTVNTSKNIKHSAHFDPVWICPLASENVENMFQKHVSKTCFKTCEPRSKCLTSWHQIRKCLRHCLVHEDTCWRQRSCQGSTAPMEMVSVCGIRGNVLGNMLGYKDLALDGSWWILMALAHLSPVCSSFTVRHSFFGHPDKHESFCSHWMKVPEWEE